MMRRYSLTANRLILALAATFIASLAVATTAAQAIVVNDTNAGGTQAGVALVPGTRSIAGLPGNVSNVSVSGSCADPWLSPDLGGPTLSSWGLCYRGGAVMHKNETFALTWDAPFGGAQRNYWQDTQTYVEQFLRDVADGSGSLGSPYAITPQYSDGGGHAQNASLFGGGCIDHGVAGGSTCEFGNAGNAGHDLPANVCAPQGDSLIALNVLRYNSVCLTDGQIQNEVSTMVSQTGIIGRTQPGYTPLVTLLLPPGVETCLDNTHTLCSSNSNLTPPPPNVTTNSAGGTIPAATYQVEVVYERTDGSGHVIGLSAPSSPQTVTTTGAVSTITVDAPPAAVNTDGWFVYVTGANGNTFWRQGGLQAFGGSDVLNNPPGPGALPPTDTAFCSYHSQVNVGGTEVAYLVQPWTAGTGCDEPGLPNLQPNPTVHQMAVDVGSRLVSPLSQAHIAAITDPGLNTWVGLNGWEIDDNLGCTPLPKTLDSVTVGNSAQNPYFLQRESNNGGVLDFDPNTYFGCAPVNTFAASFVAPSSVDQGDTVELDGASSASTLVIPNQGYAWNFGDGKTATGPSVVHSYAKAGNYNVTLTVTDRGGNTSTTVQTVQVLDTTGQAILPAPSGNGSGPGSGSGGAVQALSARLQLLPQSLKAVLHNGIAVRVDSNEAANAIATVSITRAAARRAHIQFGKSPTVRIGIGTVSSITNGSVTLHLHLSRSVASKLAHVGHVTLTVRLALVASGNQRFAIDAAGRY